MPKHRKLHTATVKAKRPRSACRPKQRSKSSADYRSKESADQAPIDEDVPVLLKALLLIIQELCRMFGVK
jgi:hypothetical protein